MPDTANQWVDVDIELKIGKLLADRQFDLIHCEDICMTQLLLNQTLTCPVVTDRNRIDTEFQSAKLMYIHSFKAKLLAIENLIKTKRLDRKLAKLFPNQIVCSSHDAIFTKDKIALSKPPLVLNNGVNT